MLDGVTRVPDIGIANSHKDGENPVSTIGRTNERDGSRNPEGLAVV